MHTTRASNLDEILGYQEYFYTRLLGTIPLLGGIPSAIFEAIHAYENWTKDTTPIKTFRIVRILSLPLGGVLWTIADIVYEIYNKVMRPKIPEPQEVQVIANQRENTKLDLQQIKLNVTEQKKEFLKQVAAADPSNLQGTVEKARQRWDLEVKRELRKARRFKRMIKTQLNDAKEAVKRGHPEEFLSRRLAATSQLVQEHRENALAAGNKAIEAAKSLVSEFKPKASSNSRLRQQPSLFVDVQQPQ